MATILIRGHFTWPTHDPSGRSALASGNLSGCLAFYVAIVPASRLLPPNGTVCVLARPAGLRLLYSGLTRRIGATCTARTATTRFRIRACREVARGVPPWASRLTRGRIRPSLKLIGAGVVLLFVLTVAAAPVWIRKGVYLPARCRRRGFSAGAELADESDVHRSEIGENSPEERSRRQNRPRSPELVLRRNTEHNLPDYNPMGWLIELVLLDSGVRPDQRFAAHRSAALSTRRANETVGGRSRCGSRDTTRSGCRGIGSAFSWNRFSPRTTRCRQHLHPAGELLERDGRR